MKISRRMAQILVFLLNSDEPVQWYFSHWGIPSPDSAAARILGVIRYAHAVHLHVTRSQVNSFNRTLGIMAKQGLITNDRATGRSSLTDKGKKLALKFDNEVRQYLKDFSFLLETNYKRRNET
jgi:hypothetical protein